MHLSSGSAVPAYEESQRRGSIAALTTPPSRNPNSQPDANDGTAMQHQTLPSNAPSRTARVSEGRAVGGNMARSRASRMKSFAYSIYSALRKMRAVFARGLFWPRRVAACRCQIIAA